MSSLILHVCENRTGRWRTLLATAVLGLAAASCAGGVVSQIELDPGATGAFRISTHCGYATLEVDINEQIWTTDGLPVDDVGNSFEPEWGRSGGDTEFEFELVNAKELRVTAVGSDVIHTYRPDPNPPGCA